MAGGVEGGDLDVKEMVGALASADSCVALGVLGGRLAAPGVGDVGEAEEFAFVGAVGEDLGAEDAAAGVDVEDGTVFHVDGVGLIKGAVEDGFDVGFAEERLEDLGGDMGLEIELDGLVVVGADAGEELVGKASDDGGVACVGVAEAASDEAADVVAGVNENHMKAFARGGDGGGDAAGSGSIDDEIEGAGGRGGLGRGGDEQGGESEEGG